MACCQIQVKAVLPALSEAAGIEYEDRRCGILRKQVCIVFKEPKVIMLLVKMILVPDILLVPVFVCPKSPDAQICPPVSLAGNVDSVAVTRSAVRDLDGLAAFRLCNDKLILVKVPFLLHILCRQDTVVIHVVYIITAHFKRRGDAAADIQAAVQQDRPYFKILSPHMQPVIVYCLLFVVLINGDGDVDAQIPCIGRNILKAHDCRLPACR